MRNCLAGLAALLVAAPASALTIDFPGAIALEVGLGPYTLTFDSDAAFDLGDFMVTLTFGAPPTAEFIPDPGTQLTALSGGAYELAVSAGPVIFAPVLQEVPEPGAAALALVGLLGLFVWGRRSERAAGITSMRCTRL